MDLPEKVSTVSVARTWQPRFVVERYPLLLQLGVVAREEGVVTRASFAEPPRAVRRGRRPVAGGSSSAKQIAERGTEPVRHRHTREWFDGDWPSRSTMSRTRARLERASTDGRARAAKTINVTRHFGAAPAPERRTGRGRGGIRRGRARRIPRLCPDGPRGRGPSPSLAPAHGRPRPCRSVPTPREAPSGAERRRRLDASLAGVGFPTVTALPFFRYSHRSVIRCSRLPSLFCAPAASRSPFPPSFLRTALAVLAALEGHSTCACAPRRQDNCDECQQDGAREHSP